MKRLSGIFCNELSEHLLKSRGAMCDSGKPVNKGFEPSCNGICIKLQRNN